MRYKRSEFDWDQTMFCDDCGEECNVIPIDNSFSYSGTHCTGGREGTHRPEGYGEPVSDCCEADCLTESDKWLEEEDEE